MKFQDVSYVVDKIDFYGLEWVYQVIIPDGIETFKQVTAFIKQQNANKIPEAAEKRFFGYINRHDNTVPAEFDDFLFIAQRYAKALRGYNAVKKSFGKKIATRMLFKYLIESSNDIRFMVDAFSIMLSNVKSSKEKKIRLGNKLWKEYVESQKTFCANLEAYETDLRNKVFQNWDDVVFLRFREDGRCAVFHAPANGRFWKPSNFGVRYLKCVLKEVYTVRQAIEALKTVENPIAQTIIKVLEGK